MTSRILFLLVTMAVVLPGLAAAETTRGPGGEFARSAAAFTGGPGGDWRYTVRPGEDIDAIASRLLRAGRDADDLLRHNSMTGSTVSAGDALQIPVQWLRQQPEPATIMSVVGEAQVKRHLERQRRPAKAGMTLNVGDELHTGSGRVIIALADESRIELDRRSHLIFNRMTQFGRTGMADTRMRLERGRVNSRVKPVEDQNSRFEIETPSAVAAIRGTAFRLNVREDGTRLEVTEGWVWFGDGDDMSMIPAGYGAWQRRGGAISTDPLAPAPQLTTRPDAIESLPFRLTWDDPGESGLYEMNLINLDTDEWLQSHRVQLRDLHLDHLENGNYRLQLAALDNQGMLGKPTTLDFSIGLSAEPARLVAPSNNSTLDDDMPAFRWAFQGDSELARVEVARDRDFDSIVATSSWAPDDDAIVSDPLPPGEYYWRVVTQAGGSSEAQSDSNRFTISGVLPATRVINVNVLGDQVRVFWQTVPDSKGYKLQLARDADFSDIVEERSVDSTSANLQLEPGTRYHVRIRGRTDGPVTSEWGPSYELSLE